MNRYKVCVYAICKNEVKFVDQWMDSMCEADIVVVTDTGSTDGTVERLRKRGAIVYRENINPWRFDVARNKSLSHVPKDVDICVCTDLDERFNKGWRKNLERAWQEPIIRMQHKVAKTGRYLYNWSLKPDGTPDIQFNYFKVHERNGFIWKCPVHEYVQYVGNLPLETVFIEGMVLNHYPDATKSRGSYLPLLQYAVQEEPQDARMRYYLGREYMYQQEWQKCIDTLKEFLELPLAKWNEERCAAMRWIATAYWRLGNANETYRWYYRAVGEAPNMRESYIEFSKVCSEQKDWEMAYFLLEEALQIKEKSSTYVNMGYAWDHTPYDLCGIAAYWLQLFDTAYKYSKKAVELAPDIERLKQNLVFIEDARKKHLVSGGK